MRKRRKIRIGNGEIFAFFDSPADFRIQLICCPAAARLDKVLPVPLKAGDKKQKQLHECAVDCIASVPSAAGTDHRLPEWKILPAVCDSNHEKHGITCLGAVASPHFVLYQESGWIKSIIAWLLSSR